MANRITHSQVYVLDQDEALDFYVGKLGFEIGADVDLGFMRWLTVNLPEQPDHQLLLEKPGPPAHDEATAELVRELVTKGAMGVAAIIEVDDIHATYEDLKAKGVDDAIASRIAPSDDVERARSILARKYRQPAGSREEQAKRMRFLQSRGFSYDTIRSVMRVDDSE